MAWAAPLHWSGKKTRWDRKNNIVELFEKAQVGREGELITADYIRLNLETNDLDAKGQCVYVMPDMVARAEEMHFNLSTRLGWMSHGKITNGQFSLQGENITRIEDDRFVAQNGEYTTCKDCASSWSLLSNEIKVKLNGYAHLSGVFFKIKDAPAFWFPYLILPIKNRRETGILMPRTVVAGYHGFQLVLPFFWNINPHMDMTIGVGTYSSRGLRFEWEGRYALTNQSGGSAQFWYTDWKYIPNQDPAVTSALGARWATAFTQSQELPLGIDQKLIVREVSDTYYPDSIGDINRDLNSYLSSELSFSKSTGYFSGFAEFKRTRNMVLEETRDLRTFDDRTVQLAPRVLLTTNDQRLGHSPFFSGFSVGLSHFSRPRGFFDLDPDRGSSDENTFIPGVDPLRKGTRFNFIPTLYTTVQPLKGLSLVPSAQYRYFVYNFGNTVDNLGRGYMLLKADLSFQLEKIFNTGNPLIPRIKHLFRPMFSYNVIPPGTLVSPETHPFVQQVENTRIRASTGETIGPVSSYVFDNYDIIPFDVVRNFQSVQIPLGHSLSYGFVTQWIRRNGHLDMLQPSYEKMVEWSASQNINFLELSKPAATRIPFSRLQSDLLMGWGRWGFSTNYQMIPDIEKYQRPYADTFSVNSGFSYTWANAPRQGILSFQRSISLGASYNPGFNSRQVAFNTGIVYSINDYILPSAAVSFNLTTLQRQSQSLGLVLQDASQCWQFFSSYSVDINGNWAYGFDLKLNLTGSGFGNISDPASAIGIPRG